jgi:hypothetical protein
MAPDGSPWRNGGRTLRWRIGMIASGALLCGFAAALVWWPALLAWTVAVGCAGLGLLCVASAFLARGR